MEREEEQLNYYQVLNVTLDATQREIDMALEKLRAGEKDKGRLQQINKAYEILHHSSRRRVYDLSLERPFEKEMTQEESIKDLHTFIDMVVHHYELVTPKTTSFFGALFGPVKAPSILESLNATTAKVGFIYDIENTYKEALSLIKKIKELPDLKEIGKISEDILNNKVDLEERNQYLRQADFLFVLKDKVAEEYRSHKKGGIDELHKLLEKFTIASKSMAEMLSPGKDPISSWERYKTDKIFQKVEETLASKQGDKPFGRDESVHEWYEEQYKLLRQSKGAHELYAAPTLSSSDG